MFRAMVLTVGPERKERTVKGDRCNSAKDPPTVKLPPCPYVVHATIGLTRGGFPLVNGNLKLNALDVDTWCDLGTCLPCRFFFQEKCLVARSGWFTSFRYQGIPSKTDKKKLGSFRSWYQILDDLNLRLAVRGEWCCNPHFGVGIYEAYLLGGLKLPLNAFAREILHRLGIGINQLNPNAWMLIISMQILWREVFYGNRPLTMDEFLYFYKPSEISQSLGFYQFFARGSNCRLVKSLSMSDRRWKTEFFFVSRFWARNPVEAHSFTDRAFHSLVTLHRLATWRPGPEPTEEALAYKLTTEMTTMQENKGKGLTDEEAIQEGEEIWSLSSRRGHKKARHGSSKPGVVKTGSFVPSAPAKQPPTMQILNVDPSNPPEVTSSKPPSGSPMTILRSEGLSWERFQQAMSDEDVAICYDMSVKEFERSIVHDLFKAMTKFIATSRQVYKLEKQRVRFEAKIRDMKKESSCQAEVKAKLEDEVKELKNLEEELKSDVFEKDTCLDHLQKRSDELYTFLGETREATIREFKASSEFTDLLDRNYATSFEDFHMDTLEHFPGVDFSPIKPHVAAKSSLLQTSSEDINIEDDASTQLAKDDLKSRDIAPSGL
ncbi:hypothetical protein SO802_026001 [Lithocarpus litseifolius]|uniref:Transposase (putative) gypsy type domain-containing protein n=1 Tax=Lithocarpus litseifolius TaxID=425828 RepID=A0AAW2C052_9ROSI